MRPVELTQLDAVKGDPGIMDCEFQLPAGLIDVHLTGFCPGNAHWPPSLPGNPAWCRCSSSRFPARSLPCMPVTRPGTRPTIKRLAPPHEEVPECLSSRPPNCCLLGRIPRSTASSLGRG